MGQMYSAEQLQLLIDQTCKLRRDPEERRKEIDRLDNERFLEENQNVVFVAEDGEMLDMGDFY